MSEPLSTNAAPAEAGNGDMINWGDPAPATETPVAPPEPPPAEAPAPETPPAAPEATPAAAPPPTPVDDFAILTLENGEKEVRLASGRSYRAKTDAELVQQLAKAQFHADTRIRELGQRQPEAPAPQPVTAPATESSTPQLDPASIAIADMLAPVLGLKNGQEVVQAWQQMNQKVQGYEQQAQQMQQNAVAAEFVREVGDFVVTPGNIDRFSEQFEKTGLPFTVDNARLVHDAMKARGVYEKVEPRQITQAAPEAPRAANGQFVPRMPLPPAPSSAAPQQETKDVWNMSDAEFREAMAQLTH